MKRSREEAIMLDALQSAGYEETASLKSAVSSGLRAIRRERYEEHVAKKERLRASGNWQQKSTADFAERGLEIVEQASDGA